MNISIPENYLKEGDEVSICVKIHRLESQDGSRKVVDINVFKNGHPHTDTVTIERIVPEIPFKSVTLDWLITAKGHFLRLFCALLLGIVGLIQPYLDGGPQENRVNVPKNSMAAEGKRENPQMCQAELVEEQENYLNFNALPESLTAHDNLKSSKASDDAQEWIILSKPEQPILNSSSVSAIPTTSTEPRAPVWIDIGTDSESDFDTEKLVQNAVHADSVPRKISACDENCIFDKRRVTPMSASPVQVVTEKPEETPKIVAVVEPVENSPLTESIVSTKEVEAAPTISLHDKSAEVCHVSAVEAEAADVDDESIEIIYLEEHNASNECEKLGDENAVTSSTTDADDATMAAKIISIESPEAAPVTQNDEKVLFDFLSRQDLNSSGSSDSSEDSFSFCNDKSDSTESADEDDGQTIEELDREIKIIEYYQAKIRAMPSPVSAALRPAVKVEPCFVQNYRRRQQKREAVVNAHMAENSKLMRCSHKEDDEFRCLAYTNDRMSMWEHWSVHNKSKAKGDRECAFCGALYSIREKFKRHLKNHHGNFTTDEHKKYEDWLKE